jgi:ADP-ribosyl-[dinitrogen reductase] hydrolase
MDMRDRYRGALLGLAVCDALGAQIEGGTLGGKTPTEMVGGGWYDVPPGGWTDDTAMALCLAESIVKTQACDLRDQMDRYVLWKQRGHLSWAKWSLGIGATVNTAIEGYLVDGKPARKNQDPARSAGNGSLMRLAPISMAFRAHPQVLRRACAASSRTTHNVPEAIDGCVLLGAMTAAALNGADKQMILDTVPVALGPLAGGIERVRAGSWRSKGIQDLGTTGYVVTTLEAAIWAFANSGDFESGARLVLQMGGDADTIGAVYGQIAGAFYGDESIPERWIEPIKMLDRIVDFADRLLILSTTGSRG